MKLTKIDKNQYPKLYGYGSLEDLLSDASQPLKHYVALRDMDGDVRFIPCTEEYFHWHRNENRNEQRRNESYAKRCPVSIDSLLEDYDFEFADPSYAEELEKETEKEITNYLLELVSEFSDSDQAIIKLHCDGHTDATIANELNKARSTVQERRVKLVKLLKEKLKKFNE